MRFGIVFALTHDGKLEIADGPGPVDEINANVKKLAVEREHPDFAELHFHEIQLSGGRKRLSFNAPKVETDSGESLEDLTKNALLELGADEQVDFTGCKVKADFVERIRAYRQLASEQTVDQLKETAKTENADVTGLTRKSDLINAVLAHRRAQQAAS